jgi:hypothetical protein
VNDSLREVCRATNLPTIITHAPSPAGRSLTGRARPFGGVLAVLPVPRETDFRLHAPALAHRAGQLLHDKKAVPGEGDGVSKVTSLL